jgi:glucosamine 6-phosphate synthetase-like amidotransferase/phosphosugar isomerase protein
MRSSGRDGREGCGRGRLPGQVAAVLDDPGPADEMAAWLANQTRLATVARGFLYGAAGEAALKIQETTSLFATAVALALAGRLGRDPDEPPACAK